MHKICIFLSLLFVCDAFADDLFSTSVVDGCSVGVLGLTNPVSINAVFEPKSITCQSGYYLPANNINCVACPTETTCNGGTWTFNETTTHGIALNDIFTQNKQYGCIPNLLGVANNVSINAVFEPKSITCSAGYFLPMNSEVCVACPTETTCSGGTWTFNETTTHGIALNDIFTQNKQYGCIPNLLGVANNVSIDAVFQPKNITCSAGYYLPADNENCAICLAGNKCVGGTYTFNETTTQGIEQCPVGTFAPAGVAECYEHLLHVGEDILYLSSTKKTTPSLNVSYGNNVYYANATTVPTTVTATSQHYLKVIYNDTEYYICDDTAYSE